MKKTVILVLAIGLFFSCNDQDENDVVFTFIWAPVIISANPSDESVTLSLSDPRVNSLYVPPGPAGPDFFDVFIGESPENFEPYLRFHDFTGLVRVDGLQNGKEYFFKVVAYKQGFDSESSNTVMTMPSKGP